MCTVTLFEIVGAPYIYGRLVVGGYGGFVDAGRLAVALEYEGHHSGA